MVNFCAAVLILKMEEDTQHLVYCAYFKKGKNRTEMHKRFVQCMEKVLWLIECVKSGLWSFLVLLTFRPNNSLLWAVLYIGKCLAAPLASAHFEYVGYLPIVGGSRHTQNIHINKVNGENKKCVFYFMEKTKQTFGQPNKTNIAVNKPGTRDLTLHDSISMKCPENANL